MKTFSSFLLITFLVVFGQTPSAAQDSGAQKIPRIGLLASEASSNRAYQRHLRHFCKASKNLAILKEKISLSSTDMPTETSIGCPNLPPTWFTPMYRLSFLPDRPH